MKRVPQVRSPGCSGFTLVELIVASAITLAVSTAALASLIAVFRAWSGVEKRMGADREVNIAMSRMVYGMGDRLGIRAAAGVPTINATAGGWTATYRTGGTTPQTNSFTYSVTASNLVFNPGSLIAGEGISFAQAIAGTQSLVVTLRVERVEGALTVRREIGTKISYRNW